MGRWVMVVVVMVVVASILLSCPPLLSIPNYLGSIHRAAWPFPLSPGYPYLFTYLHTYMD